MSPVPYQWQQTLHGVVWGVLEMSKTSLLTIARRLPFAIILWPLLYVCTFLILLGWGKAAADNFWDCIA